MAEKAKKALVSIGKSLQQAMSVAPPSSGWDLSCLGSAWMCPMAPVVFQPPKAADRGEDVTEESGRPL